MKKLDRNIFFQLGFFIMITNTVWSQQKVEVMSFNIRLNVKSDGGNRRDARKDNVAGLMNYYAADLISGLEVQHHKLQYLLSQPTNYSIESANLITQKITQLTKEENYAAVLTGDFNSKPDEARGVFMKEHFTNARSASQQPPDGPADTWNAFKFNN